MSTVALDSVDLDIDAGSFVALLGPNGSGKSTLMRTIAGELQPDAGSVVVDRDGHELHDAERRSALGVVHQTISLDPLLTVDESLRLAGAMAGLTKAETATRATTVAAQLGVTDRLNDRVGVLSGGLARRVDLARALLAQPAVLLLDEPTVGLDPAARTMLMAVLGELNPRPTIVLSTHLERDAVIAERVVLMGTGRVALDGTPAALCEPLGPRVLRVRAATEGAMDRARELTTGLRTGETPGMLVAYGLSEAKAGERATQLVRAGCAVETAAPTLDDVAVVHTSETLASTGASA